MSISNISSADNFTPCYNKVEYTFNSTNSGQSGYRYVVDLYKSGTTTKIAEFRVAPLPTTGYGYVDLSRIVQNYCTYNFNPGVYNTSLPDAFLKYDLKIGDEYNINYSIYSFSSYTIGSNNYVKVTTSLTNTFLVDDEVIVDTDILSGLFNVLSIIDTNNLVINTTWDSSYSSPTGVIYYGDNRKTITRDLYTYSNKVTFYGVVDQYDFLGYDSTTYKFTTTSLPLKKYLSNLPQVSYLYSSQDIWINFSPYYSSTAYYMYFQNSNGDIFRRSIYDSSTAVRQVAIGPNNNTSVTGLSLVSGTFPLVKTDTTYYKYWVTDSSGVQMNTTYTINLINKCKISDYEVCFVDKLGSIGSFAFPLRSKISGTITRQNYNNSLHDMSNTWDNYSTTIDIKYEQELTLNTDFFKDQNQLDYYYELLTSPYTWIKIDGDYYQCVVSDTSLEDNKLSNKKLQRKTLKVKVLNKIINI